MVPGAAIPSRIQADGGLMLRLTAGLASTLMVGFLLWVGRPVLVPIIAALMALYLLLAASHGMGRLPVLGRAPEWLRRVLALVAFIAVLVVLIVGIGQELGRAVAALPRYESNLENLVTRGAALIGIEDEPLWAKLRAMTLDQINPAALVAPVVSSLSGLGSMLFLIVLYASFMLAERASLAQKIGRAARDQVKAERLLMVLDRINDRIGRYLVVKTLVNLVLGGVSWVILTGMGVEFAGLWAVLIAILNYIPYVGSVLGVTFPTLAAAAQFGDFTGPILLASLLTVVQMGIGAILEPKMMGRAFNLSPFIVVLALVVWSTLWGVPGAVLAVPMTASLMIVLAEFPATRAVAIMLSADGRI